MNMVKKLACGVVCAAVALGAANAEAGVWLRFTFTKVRSVTQIQMSELAVYDKFGCRVNLNLTEAASGTVAEDLIEREFIVSHPGEVKNYETYLFDGKATTKYYNSQFNTGPRTVTMRLDDGTNIAGYNICTGDDQTGRDPVSWTVELSSNGVDWSVLDTQSDFVPTTTRKTWYDGKGGTSGDGTVDDYFRAPYPVTGDYFKVDPVPDQFRLVGALTPEPVVKDPDTDETLVKDVDYTLSYSNNDVQGTGTITITGKAGSAYEGKVGSVDFRIYQYVKSITSTGTQYINTGIVPGTTTAVEMSFNTTNCADNTAFFGSGSYKLSNNYAFSVYDRFYCFYGAATSMGIQHELGIDGFVSISTNAANNCYFNLSGNTVTKTVSLSYTGTTPLGLFSTGAGESKSKLTLYSFKIWQGGALVRDFVPVRRGRIACLLDRVTTNLFDNANSSYSYFLYGPDQTDITVARIPNQFYSGTALEPAVVVSNLAGTALLVKDVDYTIAYADNAATGTGKVIVTGIGEYSSVVTNTFAIYTAPAAPAMPVTAYIQHGLMNHWDALDNAGTGTFDPTARIWKDLKGSLDFTLNGNAEWGDGFLETHGYSGAAPGKAGQYLTIEIKYRNTMPRRGMPFASGYSNFRVVWNCYANQLWFHHQSGEYRLTLTGLNTTDTTYDFSVVYGTANGGADQPAYFYDSGVRKTSGISNQRLQNANMGFIPSFPTAVIGSGSETQCNYEGRIYSIRLYDCPLSAREIAYNAAVDKVRYEGVAPAVAFNASDMRWNATSGKVEVLITVGQTKGGGTLSINGGGVSEWVSVGDAVEIVYEPVSGEKALEWFDLPDDASRSSDLFTVNFTAEAPVAAKLQLLKQIDVTRALNADPGIEEGSGSFNDGASRSFYPVSWNRTADRAWIEAHGTSSEEHGWYYLRPYQLNSFFQSGLAIPAGTYTFTLEHAAYSTDGTIYEWRLYDATNGIHSICSVTNDMRTYGTSWHTIQQEFTIAEGGVYKLQAVGVAYGTHGNSYSSFDNVSITSDTDLHIEVEKCYPYFGEGQARPPVVVRDDEGNILTEGVDYELLYGANDSVGTNMTSAVTLRHGNGYVAAKGKGSHYGVAGANFRLGTPIYVKPDGSSTNGGTSWADAVDFATALTLAADMKFNNEIWIAGSNVIAAAAVQQLFYGNKIFRGGFKGTESTIEEREEGAYSTIDCDGQFSAVVFKINCNAHFERLRFRGSPARAVSKVHWGGDVFFNDCIFEDNSNAVYVQGVSKTALCQGSVYVKDSVFRNNSSTDDAHGAAALYSYQTRRVSAENTLFASNTLATSTKTKTTAIFAYTSALELKECDFVGNVGSGTTYGTVRASGSDAKDVIQNCLFLGNLAGGANAAQVTIEHSNVKTPSEVVNCTFAANTNTTANGCAGVKMTKGKMSIRNSIFYGNSGSDFLDTVNCPYDVDYTMLVDDTGATYSFVNVLSKLGDLMIYGDPLFAATDDCHLLSEAGYFDSEGVIHYAAEDVRSPAIDAGDPESDFSRESEPNGVCINLGRYGNTEQASRTPAAVPAVAGAPTVEWNDPDGYSMPTVSFTMGGSGSYTAHGIVYVSTDGGTTWEEASGMLSGLAKGDTKVVRVPGYYIPGDTIQVKVAVEGAGQSSESEVASVVVAGTLPPWYGKKGPANVIHVRPGALGKNDGTSWTDAFTSWAYAVEMASALKNEIWVAGTNMVVNPLATKAFDYDVVVRGGFRGWEESPAERPEGLMSVIDGQVDYDCFNFSNPKSTWVERIEFRRGNRRGLKKFASAGDVTLTNCVFYGNSYGGSSPWDCQSNVNLNYQNGGGGAGLYGSGSAKATVVDCRFEGNISCPSGNCGWGGGLFVGSFGGGADIFRCSFVTNRMSQNFNSSGGAMAAMHIYNTRATVEDCTFRGHRAGGTADLRGSCAGSVIRRCDFVGNYVENSRQAIFTVNLANATDSARIENCTFAYNLDCPALDLTKGAVAVTNCIFYGNLVRSSSTDAADLRVAADATATVDYCLFAVAESGGSKICVSEVTAGSLNMGSHCIYGDPLFVTLPETVLAGVNVTSGSTWPRVMANSNKLPSYADRVGYNVHLRGGCGYFDEATGDLVKTYAAKKAASSPAIDAGDPKSDYKGEPDTQMGWHGRRVNMGGYGNTPWATLTPFPGAAFYLR